MPPSNPGSWKCEAEEGLQQARLTLHEADPITGNEDLLSSLFYEFYRGYTLYSTPRGRCCIHGTQGCLKLLGRFVCFYDVEDAKTFIKHLRRAGYRASDPVERSLAPEAYVWLNGWTPTTAPGGSARAASLVRAGAREGKTTDSSLLRKK